MNILTVNKKVGQEILEYLGIGATIDIEEPRLVKSEVKK